MSSETLSRLERWAGFTSGAALLAWSATVIMWISQVLSWLFGAAVPHPSVLGIIRTLSVWFDIGRNWASDPHLGFSAYNVLKHLYLTSTCLVVAIVLSAVSVILVLMDDRNRNEADARRMVSEQVRH